MKLYPQIPSFVAQRRAAELATLNVQHAADASALLEPSSEFTPTGGVRVGERDLAALRNDLTALATLYGYPDKVDRLPAFDAEAAARLPDLLRISIVEASRPGVWGFLTCVLVPHLVAWRFGPGDKSPIGVERFLPGRRNTIQRLWLRGRSFAAEDCRPLLAQLGEDELVQLMERPRLAGVEGYSAAVAKEFLLAVKRHPNLSRRTLIRESQKRLRRLDGIIAIEMLDERELRDVARSVFDNVALAVTS